MAEVNALSNDQLVAKTREFEAEIRKLKSQMTRITHELKDLDTRIKENKDKLNLST